MARVFTQKAGKDYPAQGIKKGDVYYQWSFFRGPTMRSATRPRPSQLINSPTHSMAVACGEALEDALNPKGDAPFKCPNDVKEAIEGVLGKVEEAISDHEEAISTMQDAFPNGNPTIEEFETRRDALQQFQSDIEDAVNEIDTLDPQSYIDDEAKGKSVETFDDLNEEEKSDMIDAALEAAANVELSL